MKSEKSFFDLEKNDEHESFDDDKSNASASASANANANNLSNDMNENEDQTDPAKDSQKKENAMTKIARDEQTKSDSKNDWEEFFDF